jgi:hypothetical protein
VAGSAMLYCHAFFSRRSILGNDSLVRISLLQIVPHAESQQKHLVKHSCMLVYRQ